jgi:Clp amino terminal domain, pathogenicity island component
MFERYTEKARRVIFFARYEASQYGSPYIETEHLLLGLLREDRALMKQFLVPPSDAASQIRAEIERHIPPRERIPTSIEVPLTSDSKKVLHFAAEEADRLAHRHIGTEHMLLGILRVEGSLATQILQARGLKLAEIREQLPKDAGPAGVKTQPLNHKALSTLEDFLSGLKKYNSEQLLPFFAKNAHFVDASGKPWNREEIDKHFETLFILYAKKNATYAIEETIQHTKGLQAAIVLWKNAVLASMERSWMQRMTVVLVPEAETDVTIRDLVEKALRQHYNMRELELKVLSDARAIEDWKIVLVQVTPVQSL